MSCFPCFSSQRSKKSNGRKEQLPVAHANNDPVNNKQKQSPEAKNKKDEAGTVDTGNIAAQNYTFRELATATKNFRQECLLGEGGFGRVFKGTLQSSGQVVVVKQLDRNGTQGSKEFLVEVLMLSLIHHPNLLNLVGYCADGDQRLLVYEYMPLGSLEEHLLQTTPDKNPLDWLTRMKIASGAAQGLEYLHEKANPPIIYRDLKSSNVMLNEEFNPVLSDFGLTKLGPTGNKTHLSPRLMGNDGYCAPEYERNGELTLKSDIYSFGVVLLELITGRRAIDATRPTDEQNLVTWAQPIFRDPKRFSEMADPLLRSEFPVKSLNQAVGVAAMCLQEEPLVRPLISDVVAALSFLTMVVDDPAPSLPDPVPSEVKISTGPEDPRSNHESESSSDDDRAHSDQGNGDHNENGSDQEGGDSSENSDEEEEEEEESESEDHQKLEKAGAKSIKWGSNSIHESKFESQERSIGSSSRQSSNFASQDNGSFGSGSVRNSNADPNDKMVGANSNFRLNLENRLYSWSYSNVESEEGSFRSNVDHMNSMKSKDGSILGSYSGRKSDVGSEDESVRSFSGRISNVGSHAGSVSSNGRRVSNVGSEH